MAFSAVVARTGSKGIEYLVSNIGRSQWAQTASSAARYQTLREATREALRLPSTFRAFALPSED